MGRFLQLATRPVSLGPCQCPGSPHEEDTAEVYTVLGWDDLVDVGMAESEGAGRRILTTRAIASWNLVELDDGEQKPVPVSEATVRLLGAETLETIAEAVNEAYARGRDPVPNASGAPSPASSRGSASRSRKKSPTPTTST